MESNYNRDDNIVLEQLDKIFNLESRDWIRKSSNNFFRLMSYYKCAMMEIETKFNVLNEEYSVLHDRNPINAIKTRLKKPIAIKNKLERLGLPFSADSINENLQDVAGVRVICSFKNDVYLLANALLKQDDIELIKRKDYIQNPKENGYRSLHLIVAIPIFLSNEKKMMKVEIQLRTIAMDFWASLEHQLRYKKDFTITERMGQELSECAEVSADLDERMDNLRSTIQEQTDQFDAGIL